MPKGVEHLVGRELPMTVQPVFYPLMPKGVEHYFEHYHNRDIERVLSVDAERR